MVLLQNEQQGSKSKFFFFWENKTLKPQSAPTNPQSHSFFAVAVTSWAEGPRDRWSLLFQTPLQFSAWLDCNFPASREHDTLPCTPEHSPDVHLGRRSTDKRRLARHTHTHKGPPYAMRTGTPPSHAFPPTTTSNYDTFGMPSRIFRREQNHAPLHSADSAKLSPWPVRPPGWQASRVRNRVNDMWMLNQKLKDFFFQSLFFFFSDLTFSSLVESSYRQREREQRQWPSKSCRRLNKRVDFRLDHYKKWVEMRRERQSSAMGIDVLTELNLRLSGLSSG